MIEKNNLEIFCYNPNCALHTVFDGNPQTVRRDIVANPMLLKSHIIEIRRNAFEITKRDISGRFTSKTLYLCDMCREAIEFVANEQRNG